MVLSSQRSDIAKGIRTHLNAALQWGVAIRQVTRHSRPVGHHMHNAYVVRCSGHAIAVCDGDWYGTFDSAEEPTMFFRCILINLYSSQVHWYDIISLYQTAKGEK